MMRDVNLAGGHGLEAHERLSLLTVAAGLRPFCLLNHIQEEDFPLAVETLSEFGLTSGVCKASLKYELDVRAPAEIIEAFENYEIRSSLYGLGVAYSRIDFGDRSLGDVLSYPRCCVEMDDDTKRFDRSATLKFLIESKGGDYAAVIAALSEGTGISTPSTERRLAWDRRFDQTHIAFPFAVHTACDKCLERGAKSPRSALSRRYESMARAAAFELYDAVLRQNEVFRHTSRLT